MKIIPPRTRREREERRGFRGYPVGPVAWYGPDATRATKVAVALVPAAGAEPVALERWVATQGDVRNEGLIGQHVLAFLVARCARTVVRSPGIIGFPHEGASTTRTAASVRSARTGTGAIAGQGLARRDRAAA
jgi:hypothetical protein